MTDDERPAEIDGYHPALRLLDLMWGTTPDAWSTLSHRPDGGDHLVHTAVRTDDRDTWAGWFAAHHDTDCYFRVCPMGEPPDLPARRGDASLSIAVPCLWGDIDVRSPKHPTAPEPEFVVERLRALADHLPPSAVVNTGNGWQPYLLLDEPVDPSVAVELLARWGKQLRNLGLVDDRKGDLASLMRLPGTVNTNGGACTALRLGYGPHGLADLDERLPVLEPGEMPTAPDGVPLANDAEVAEFLDRHQGCDYPRALQRAVEGIDATVARQGGARHPSLRMFLWQTLSEAAVGGYPARQAVDEGYAHWQRHVAGERRPRNELAGLLRWQVPKVVTRTDLDVVRARLDDVFGEVQMGTGQQESTAAIQAPPKPGPRAFRTVIRTADQLDVRPTPQLIRGWFPRAEACVVVGKPGVGKGVVMADVIARGTLNQPMPNGDRIVGAFASAVICLPGEDDEKEWGRRLKVAGALLEQVQIVEDVEDDAGEKHPVGAATIAMVVEDVARGGAELVVIDSLTGLTNSAGLDTNKGEARAVLDGLSKAARRFDLTVVILHHARKAGGDPLDILQGNTQLGAASRSVLVTVEERAPDGAEPDVRLFGVAKLNGSRRSAPVGFRLVGATLKHPDGAPMRDDRGDIAHIPRVDWIDRTFSQGELLAACNGTVLRAQGRDQDADGILAGGPMLSNDYIDAMDAAGHGPDAARRARENVGGTMRHAGRWWSYPKGMTPADAKQVIVALVEAEQEGAI